MPFVSNSLPNNGGNRSGHNSVDDKAKSVDSTRPSKECETNQPSKEIDSVRELNRLLESALRMGGDERMNAHANVTAGLVSGSDMGGGLVSNASKPDAMRGSNADNGNGRSRSNASAAVDVGDGGASWRLDTARRLSSLLSTQNPDNLDEHGSVDNGSSPNDDLLLPALRRQSRYWIPLLLSWLRQAGGDDYEDPSTFSTSFSLPGKQRRNRQASLPPPPPVTNSRPEVQIEALRALTALTEWTARLDDMDNQSTGSQPTQSKTPFSSATVTAGCNPQNPLSSATQKLLLRHAEAIPMIVSLLSSPDSAVHEQAVWILGSIASGGLSGGLGASLSQSTGQSPMAAAASAAAAEVTKVFSSQAKDGGGLDGSVSVAVPTPALSGNAGGSSKGPANPNNGNDFNKKAMQEAIMGTLSSPAGNSAASELLRGGASSGGNAGTALDDSLLKDPRNKDKSSSPTIAARDIILAAGALEPLLQCLDSNPLNISLHRIGAWCLSSIMEGRYSSSNSQSSNNDNSGNSNSSSKRYSPNDEINIITLLPTLKRMLHMDDTEVLTYTCWTLSHLCDGPSSHIAAVIYSEAALQPSKKKGMRSFSPEGGLVPRLVELLIHPSPKVAKPALRTIGNIVCAECTDQQNKEGNNLQMVDYTEVILDCNAVPCLRHLVAHENREIQKEACWTLSNIAAGTTSQIQAVIDSGAIPPLVDLVNNEKTDKEVRSEACWVVLNATSCGSEEQIEILVEEGCVSVLGVLLNEPSMVMMALEGLEKVLQTEEAKDAAILRSKAAALKGGLYLEPPILPQRQTTLKCSSLIKNVAESSHNSSSVLKRAKRIWDSHFVSCALCHGSFSRHRNDARFCNECKCHVCFNCDCRVYHLSYQEELWAEDEDKAEAKKNAKKSKKQKKKEKEKQKKEKKKQQIPPQQMTKAEPAKTNLEIIQEKKNPTKDNNVSHDNGKNKKRESVELTLPDSVDAKSSSSPNTPNQLSVEHKARRSSAPERPRNATSASPSRGTIDDDSASLGLDGDGVVVDNENNQGQPPIDLVLYLQQTGSIIALAKLMDSLYDGSDYDDEDVSTDHTKINVKQSVLKGQ